jgi:hypothetical protein
MGRASLPVLALVAGLILTAGCSSNQDKVVSPDGKGTNWVSEAATVKGEEVPAGSRLLKFSKDGHLLYNVSGRPYKGSYALGMGQAVTFTLDDELDGRRIHPHKIVIEGDQLTLTSADGSALIFHKQE